VKYKGNTVTLSVNVLNVFDQKTTVNTTTSISDLSYRMGRQFFAGIQYKF
jgi:outer membrane receptor protein involved in Fe transport